MQIHSLSDWQDLAKQLIPGLKPGDILALSGPLGAGKTTFVQALAKELGSTHEPTSPTFALMRTYFLFKERSSLSRLVHVDAYRLERSEDMLPLNLEEELSQPGTLLVIEWPEHVFDWLKRYEERVLTMRIEPLEAEVREVTLTKGLTKLSEFR